MTAYLYKVAVGGPISLTTPYGIIDGPTGVGLSSTASAVVAGGSGAILSLDALVAAGVLQSTKPLNLWAMQQQLATGTLGGATGPTGATGVGATGVTGATGTSDINLKTDIILVGVVNNINLYRFKYKANPRQEYVGVIAQEIKKSHPEAVIERMDGTLAVNYSKLGLRMVTLEEYNYRVSCEGFSGGEIRLAA